MVNPALKMRQLLVLSSLKRYITMKVLLLLLSVLKNFFRLAAFYGSHAYIE